MERACDIRMDAERIVCWSCRWRKTQDADIIGVTLDITQAKSIRIPSIAFGKLHLRARGR
jgi:hypothetical protein